MPLDAGPEALAARLYELSRTDGRAFAYLKDLCETAPRRLSGTADAERAVAWGQRVLTEMGFEGVRAEPVRVPRWRRGSVASLQMIPGPEFSITALGGSVPTPVGGIEAEVVMVRSFEQLRAMGDAAKGKIVFFNRPMNPRLRNTFIAYRNAVGQRGSGAVEAAQVGAVAAVVRSMTTSLDDFPHTGAMGYRDGVPRVPACAISTKGAEQLALLVRAGTVRLRLELDCRMDGEVMSANVVGDYRGSSRPEEIVLIGGHLDSWDLGQGAHDDGAGIAHCLGAVHLLQQAGIRPARTIRVVMFMNEENGLRGAAAYPEAHMQEMDRHVASIESDRGGFEPRGFTTSAREARLAELQAMLEPLRKYGMGAVVPAGGGPDIRPLGPLGVELFALLPESKQYFDFHHSAKDVLDNVVPETMERGAFALAFLVARLANQESAPPIRNP